MVRRGMQWQSRVVSVGICWETAEDSLYQLAWWSLLGTLCCVLIISATYPFGLYLYYSLKMNKVEGCSLDLKCYSFVQCHQVCLHELSSSSFHYVLYERLRFCKHPSLHQTQLLLILAIDFNTCVFINANYKEQTAF